MSLLDDVSIVVTPNGYKAGELYAVVPVPTEGAELVTNGDFATDSDWTLGGLATISGGNANFIDGGSNTYSYIRQNISQTSTKQYLLQFEIKNYVSGAIQVLLQGVSSTGTYNSNGVYSVVLLSGTTNGYIEISRSYSGGTYSFSIDNVSVKEYTSADMDVTRATAATRVDEDGLVNYAEVIGSELVTNGDFSNGTADWEVEGFSSMDVGTYQGRNNVLNVNILNTATSSRIRQPFDYVSGVTYLINVDVYLESGDFRVDSSDSFVSGDFVNTNTTGSWQTLTAYITASGTGSNYIWLRSTSQISQFYISNISVKEVIRDNVPRIDYTGGGCPHILSEPQRTNLLPYSEDFSNADWGNASVGTTPVLTSGFTSPDGTNNAYKISNANQNSFWFSATTIGASDSRSIYARTVSGTGTAQLLSHNTNTNNTFNLTEEWQRFEVSTTTSGTGNTSYYAVDFRGGGTLDKLLIWGAQVEVGSYPTSYIPTSGSTVTRNQDIFTRDGIGSLINSTEGVLFVELSALANDGTSRRISLSDGSISNRVSLELDETANKIKAFITLNGASEVLEYTASDLSIFNKIAIKWKANDFAIWFNGSAVVTETAESRVPTGLTELVFEGGNSLSPFYGKVKQLQVYTTALTDAQLTSLTS
jgi:hypothetical protein